MEELVNDSGNVSERQTSAGKAAPSPAKKFSLKLSDLKSKPSDSSSATNSINTQNTQNNTSINNNSNSNNNNSGNSGNFSAKSIPTDSAFSPRSPNTIGAGSNNSRFTLDVNGHLSMAGDVIINDQGVEFKDMPRRASQAGREDAVNNPSNNNYTSSMSPSLPASASSPTSATSTSSSSYKLSIDQLDILQSVGKGQYGTVYKAYHRPSKRVMALKEVRLEISEGAMKQILMELEVLHRSASNPYIVSFYGAFFTESSVYSCLEYMDAGSIDQLYSIGSGLLGAVPASNNNNNVNSNRSANESILSLLPAFEITENLLSQVAFNILSGLIFLKEELSIIHRDVKPTNILINTRGQVKLCDFGVSGKLIQSMAKTNIGCQSYMAPERIAFNSVTPNSNANLSSNAAGNTGNEGIYYSVQSDVWSFGVTMVEIATGKYPYSQSETSLFAQLAAIVQGEVPNVSSPPFSKTCQDFISLWQVNKATHIYSNCLLLLCSLKKNPKERANYHTLLEHPFITGSRESAESLADWVNYRMMVMQEARERISNYVSGSNHRR